MMINFNQLRIFYQTAKYESCSVAAEKLFITQPAVTAQVKAFEDSCNLKLFKKRGRKIYLTDEGKKVFTYASRIFELEKQLEETISGFQNLKQGSLRIGTTKTYARYIMPILLTPFQKSFPDIIIIVIIHLIILTKNINIVLTFLEVLLKESFALKIHFALKYLFYKIKKYFL